MNPTHAEIAEYVVPIEIARLELAGGGVAAVGYPHGAAHAKTAFGEIEAVANEAANAVKGHPLDKLGFDAALQNEILDQPTDVVVGKGGGNRGLEAETA